MTHEVSPNNAQTLYNDKSKNTKDKNNGAHFMLDDHNYTCNSKMTFSLLNVCGLRSKLMFDDFTEFIEKSDFVCLTEVKLDKYDAD